MSRQFLLTAVTVLTILEESHSAPSTKLDEIFTHIRARLDLAIDVANAKLKSCKVIEDSPREVEILATIVTQAPQNGLSKEEVETFYTGQMEANKIIQYNAVVLDKSLKTKKVTVLTEIRTKINALDKLILPLIKPSLAELSTFKTPDECLAAVAKIVDPQLTDYYRAALLRAATLYIETCLKPPVCSAPQTP